MLVSNVQPQVKGASQLQSLASAWLQNMRPWGCHAELHFVDGGPLTLQYLLAVDTINFCFWPTPGLEYEHLARGLKVCTGPQYG